MRLPATALGLLLSAAGTGVAHADWRGLLNSLSGSTGQPATTTTVTATALSDAQIGDGLRQALTIGAERAVQLLSKPGGYLDDPQVHIPLPEPLEAAARGLRMIGRGQLADDFETAVNRAAEQAVQRTFPIVRDTVTSMSLGDVRGILQGGDDAATRYLRERAGVRLAEAVRPIVAQATDNAGATAAYKRLVTQVQGSLGGWVDTGSLDLDDYVTTRTLDGLYTKLAEEERRIRKDPVARSTELLKKVFGG